MNFKLIALTLTSLALISTAIYKYQLSSLKVQPTNVDLCAVQLYPLIFEDIKFTNEIKPGQTVSLEVDFAPLIKSRVDYMNIAAYKDEEVIYTYNNDKKFDFNDLDDFRYTMDFAVPKDVPQGPLKIELNWFDENARTLACIKFDLSF